MEKKKFDIFNVALIISLVLMTAMLILTICKATSDAKNEDTYYLLNYSDPVTGVEYWITKDGMVPRVNPDGTYYTRYVIDKEESDERVSVPIPKVN